MAEGISTMGLCIECNKDAIKEANRNKQPKRADSLMSLESTPYNTAKTKEGNIKKRAESKRRDLPKI